MQLRIHRRPINVEINVLIIPTFGTDYNLIANYDMVLVKFVLNNNIHIQFDITWLR